MTRDSQIKQNNQKSIHDRLMELSQKQSFIYDCTEAEVNTMLDMGFSIDEIFPRQAD